MPLVGLPWQHKLCCCLIDGADRTPEYLDALHSESFSCAMQRTPQKTPFRDSWPTLFVGPEGSSSALHVDQSHTNFYMILMQGDSRPHITPRCNGTHAAQALRRLSWHCLVHQHSLSLLTFVRPPPHPSGEKRWVFFHPDDVDLLYPTWARGQLDPTFEPLDAMLGNSSKVLVTQARRMECTLKAGEVLFVPAGSVTTTAIAHHDSHPIIPSSDEGTRCPIERRLMAELLLL